MLRRLLFIGVLALVAVLVVPHDTGPPSSADTPVLVAATTITNANLDLTIVGSDTFAFQTIRDVTAASPACERWVPSFVQTEDSHPYNALDLPAPRMPCTGLTDPPQYHLLV